MSAPSTIIAIFSIIFVAEFALSARSFLFESASIETRAIFDGKNVTHRNNYTNLDSIDHHNFPNIIDITIETQQIPILYEGAVKDLPQLENVRLSFCGARKIAPGAFRNLPNLTRVYLNDNELDEIKEGVFNSLTMTNLDLHNNKIKYIHPNALDDMPKLQLIELSGNDISIWDKNWFKNCPNLVGFFFSRNHIQQIPAGAFGNVPSGEDLTIFLSNNEIDLVHPKAFEGLTKAGYISLFHNRISELDKETFANFVKLDRLWLAENQLVKLDKDSLRKLKEMEMLNVASNHIDCLPYQLVAVAKIVTVSQNRMSCNYVDSLREKLAADNISHTIINYDVVCDFLD